jgi:pectate lyase-like protein/uncharacterized protein DUF4955
MDRRDFLAAAAAGLLLVNPAPATAQRRRAHRLWTEWLATPNTHPLVPNVSYAGYRRGEVALPDVPVAVDVTSYGAVGDGVTDSTAAFTAAVDAAGAAGGGAVFVPPGEFVLTGVLWMHHSGVVLRGAGRTRTTLRFDASLTEAYRPPSRGEWSWNGGLVWFLPREVRTALEEQGFTGNEGWLGNNDLASVTEAVPRGSTRVPVSDPGAFRVGEHVLLLADNVEDSSLLAHLAGDIPGTAGYPWPTAARRLRPELTDWVLRENFRQHRWPVAIGSIEDGAVVLAQPTRIDLRPAWRPRFATLGPVVAESGIEHLTIRMREIQQPPHHQDPGFNGPHFQASLNCWAGDVDVWHSDNGFGTTTSKNVTMTGVRVGGRARHHSFICRTQTHDLLVSDFEIPPATTPLAPGAGYHGINTEGMSAGNVWAGGTMDGTFDSHKALPFDSVRTAVTVANTGDTGGAADAGPRWGARFCHWNIEVTNGRAHGIRLEEHAPYSAIVGVRGTSGPTDHEPEFTGPLHSVADALGSTVAPENLYAAQLAARRQRR